MVAGVLSLSVVGWIGIHKTFEDAHDRTTDSEQVHGNDDRSNRMHIVYEIYAIPGNGNLITLKYGISCQNCFITKPGNPRPEYQIPYYQLKYAGYNYIIWYKILRKNISNRRQAKKIE